MIHLFHGEDVVSSRKELSSLRKRFADRENIVMDGKKLTLLQLAQALESHTLFGNERVVIIERLLRRFGKGKTKEFDQYVPGLLATTHEVILWEDKELGKTILKKFPQTIDIALFKPSQILFRFLESLAPGKSSQLLEQYRRLLLREAPELIAYLLVRQVRLLLLARQGGKIAKVAPWQRQRLEGQASRFGLSQLQRMYSQLFMIDTQTKRGLAPFDISRSLELFLIEV